MTKHIELTTLSTAAVPSCFSKF